MKKPRNKEIAYPIARCVGSKHPDADQLHELLHIQYQKGKGLVITEPKTEKSRRLIAVPQFTLDALKEHQEKTGNKSGC